MHRRTWKRRRRPPVRVGVLATLLFAWASVPAWSSGPADEPTVSSFLNRYCAGCHGDKEQKGDRRFDTLPPSIAGDDSLVDYQDIVDQLNLGEMPPEDSDQPSRDERRRAIRALNQQIRRYHAERDGTGGRPVLRRLNSREYRHTIRDLLHLNMTMFDPTARFPLDQTDEHLDNLGETLVTSGHLLSRYLEAAGRSIDKALGPPQKPAVQSWTFRDDFRQQPEIDQVHRRTNGYSYMTLYDVVGADKHEGAYGPILNFAEGVPHDGYYEIRLLAEAVNRINPYDPEFLGTDPSEPLRLGIVAGNHEVGNLHVPQPVEPLLAEIDLADEPQWYSRRVWLDEGYTPRFTFRNGLMDVRNLWSRLIKKYRDQFPDDIDKGIVAARFNAIKHGKLPQIHIHEIEISGPHYEQWPTASQAQLLQGHDPQTLDSDPLRSLAEKFAARAYRRVVEPSEVDRIMRVIERRMADGSSPVQAYADGMKAVLCSPNFLYLRTDDSHGGSSDPYALASRLSYFLWSSMPDDRLLSLAARGQLADPDEIRRQVGRMLGDPKSDAFVDGFLGSWLALRDLGSTPPDRGDFRDFYHYDLDAAMRRETHLFMRHMIDMNLELVNFLDSEFGFVNKHLAKLYGTDAPSGSGFEFVQFRDRRRGGLLGQASVLTLTANGIDTSPVVRGVWLLDNLLGTPPLPPPPDVEPLDPDTRGAATIRDQLEKHRDNPSCFDCHRKIDPLGFALENFDPVGRWRDTYDRGVKIEASGALSRKQHFDDVVGFKKLLVQRKDQFARAVVNKLLSYATGRRVVPSDRPHVDRILATTRDQGYRFHDLIVQVALSEPFLGD